MRDTVLIAGLIVFGFLLNSLMDGIAFSKGNRDLNTLWHLAKYACFACVVVFSALFGRHSTQPGFETIHYVIIAASILIGAIAWEVAYRFWRTIDWPDWA
ncbi:MAG TPA: hypothetical protein VGA99_09135 [bacterium]